METHAVRTGDAFTGFSGATVAAAFGAVGGGESDDVDFFNYGGGEAAAFVGATRDCRLLQGLWREADHWMVGRWVIMPDHLHLFCAPAASPSWELKGWARFWRSQATRRWPCQVERPIWQRDFFDRRLRGGESYQQKWAYVCENPVRAGLVKHAGDWSYQGEMNVLRWRESE